jgi:hypothetical protein
MTPLLSKEASLSLPRRGGLPRFALAALLLYGLWAVGDSSPTIVAAAPAGGPIRLVQADSTGVEVQLDLPDYVLREVTAAGREWLRIEAPGLDTLALPGEPDLPGAAVLVGLPAEGTPRLTWSTGGTAQLAAPQPVIPLASPVRDMVGEDGSGAQRAFVPDPAAYGRRGPEPADVVSLVDVGWVRGQRVGRLVFRPFQLDAVAGQLIVHSQLSARLDFAPGPPRSPAEVEEVAADSAFDPVMDAALVNGAAARDFRLRRGPRTTADSPSGPATIGPSEHGAVWNLTVGETGWQRVTGADLALAGMDLSQVDPRRLQLYADGQPVAVRLEGESDGKLGAADVLLFYGAAKPSRYASTAVYQLAEGTGRGLRMAVRDGTPVGLTPLTAVTDTLRLERDTLYRSDLPRSPLGQADAPGVDRWYWQQLQAPNQLVQLVVPPDVAPGDWTGRLRLAVVGKSSFPAVQPDHDVNVWVGDRAVGYATWDGAERVELLQFAVPAERLRATPVRLVVDAVGDTPAPYDQFLVDWLELDYQRGLVAQANRLRFTTADSRRPEVAISGFSQRDVILADVTDPARPVWLVGAQTTGSTSYRLRFADPRKSPRSYAAAARAALLKPTRIEQRPATDLVSPVAGADYLMIAPASLLPVLAPLAAHRRAQGLRVAMVDVQSVYDAFGGGNPSPEAIRAFLSQAYQQWPAPAPSHVLLAGDGNYDPRNRLGTSPASLIPPYLKVADPWLGEVAAENMFVTVSGDDPFPDLYLGRLPVNSASEAAAVVAKILAYETTPPGGEWRRRLLLVADDADSAGDFAALSDEVARDHVPAGYTTDRVYLGVTQPDGPAAHAAVVKGLKDGYLLTQYIGHGLIVAWAQEQLLGVSDLKNADSGGRLPVFLDMTCMTGFFADPALPSIAESAVRSPKGGAVASFSPTGFGVSTGHDVLNRTFMDRLLGDGTTHLGAVAMASKLALGTRTTAFDDLLDTFAILGDPALRVQVPDVAPSVGSPTPSPVPIRPTVVGGPTTATATASPVPVTVTPAPRTRRVFLPLTLRPKAKRR